MSLDSVDASIRRSLRQREVLLRRPARASRRRPAPVRHRAPRRARRRTVPPQRAAHDVGRRLSGCLRRSVGDDWRLLDQRGLVGRGRGLLGDDRTVLSDVATLGDGVGHQTTEQRAGANGVVVARDDVVDHVGVTVGVDDRDDRQAELAGLGHGDVLLLRVDHEDGVGDALEIRDTREVAVEFLEFAAVAQRLALGHVVEVTGALHRTQFHHALHATGDGGEVGEHAAQPALVDEGHAAGLGVVLDGTLGLLLGAHEEDHAAVGDEVAHVGVARLDAEQGLAQIDEVNAVALAEDESTHLGIPTAGLVSEMDSGVQEFLQGDECHVIFPSVRLLDPRGAPEGDRTKPRELIVNPPTAGEPNHDSRWAQLAPRVGVVMDLLESRLRDVGVDLSRRETLVTEQFLDHAQVRAALQEVRRVGVA